MRRCEYCNRVYLHDFKNCPLCGKYTTSWEPVEKQAEKESVPQLVKRILQYMMHMGD